MSGLTRLAGRGDAMKYESGSEINAGKMRHRVKMSKNENSTWPDNNNN
jgi:hypothetical protein